MCVSEPEQDLVQDKGSLRPSMDKLGALQQLEAHQASHDATDQHAACIVYGNHRYIQHCIGLCLTVFAIEVAAA